MKENLKLWNKVCVSDPKTLKKLEFGFKPTVIDAQSQVKKATEIFGPMGLGWGVKDEIRHFEDKWIFYSAILWFKNGDQIGEVAICSDCQIKNDCMKTTQTDAITKGLSRLGFNSDVFENKWDGNKYIGEKDNPQPIPPTPVSNGVPAKTTKRIDGVPFKLEVYPSTDKVKYGLADLKKKSYEQCTKSELLKNKTYFGDPTSDKSAEMITHINTIDALLILKGIE